MVQRRVGLHLRNLIQMAVVMAAFNAGIAAHVEAKDGMKIVAFGDSLTAGSALCPPTRFQRNWSGPCARGAIRSRS